MQSITGSGTTIISVCPYSEVMRVVAGTFRGRRLVAPRPPSGPEITRPTTDRVREAIFNALASRDLLHDAVVVDLCAGSGALGIEALSRGAKWCSFVERDRHAVEALRTNLAHLGVIDRTDIVVADVMGAWDGLPRADLVLADPPYAFDRWHELLGRVRADLVVAESDRALLPPEGWTVTNARRYGRTWVTWFERVP
jgi:16S rRNA (guanine966-N2)-methyltransferase